MGVNCPNSQLLFTFQQSGVTMRTLRVHWIRCLWVSNLLVMVLINRVVCNISLWIFIVLFKTIMTENDWSAIFRKNNSIFSSVFLTRTIGRIIVKSEFKINSSIKMSVSIVTGHLHSADFKIAPKRTTRNCHLNQYFYKIHVNYNYCDIVYCPNMVLQGIYHHKYRLYQFQTFLWVTMIFKPC